MEPEKENRRCCPGCGKSMLPGFPFCYHCLSFVTEDGEKLLEPEQLDPKNLQYLLNLSEQADRDHDRMPRQRVAMAIFTVGFLLFVGSFVGVLFTDGTGSLRVFFVSLPVMILSFLISPKKPEVYLTAEQMQKILEKYMAPPEIRKLLGQVFYRPEEGLPEEIIKDAECFLGEYAAYRGKCLLEGSFQGIPYRMSHISLTRRNRRNNCMEEAFGGYCLLAETKMEFPCKFRLIQKAWGWIQKPADPQTAVESDFDAIFDIYTRNGKETYDFLTPELKAGIVALLHGIPGDLHMTFWPNGKILIACQDVLGEFHKEDSLEKWRKTFCSRIRNPFRVLSGILELTKP